MQHLLHRPGPVAAAVTDQLHGCEDADRHVHERVAEEGGANAQLLIVHAHSLSLLQNGTQNS